MRAPGMPGDVSRSRAMLAALVALAGLIFAAGSVTELAAFQRVQAPPAQKPEMVENCPGLVAANAPRVVPASLKLALNSDQARLTYVGHSTFLIESPQLVRVATDYNDYVRTPVLPDIVTMNHAHPNHYTDLPDPDIKFVLRGWRDDGKPAGHDVSFGDVRVRSVSTNIRNLNGGTEFNGNSIFVFEMGNLCIAHLGHLHHTLTQQQLDEMGRIDVLLVPVDGAFTMDMDGMVEVVRSIRAPLMVPMHFFNTSALHRFLDRVGRHYDIDYAEVPSFVVSKETLPTKPKFLVLPGR
jgi:L-ascorbate metabolism protein UlaG (beta-lactamase superfamily)